jgi:tRNA-dihydrouridine synthase C
MEGITDAPMRALLSERGGFTYCVSEFLRISQEIPPRRTVAEHVPEIKNSWKTSSGVPVQIQFLGGDPNKLARSALLASDLGCRAIDLNFGCPAPIVNRNDGGATLLKYPERIFRIVSEVRNVLPASVPVSAKLRLGWDDPKAIFLNAEMAAKGGASWITIHGRTKVQGYTPPAYWKPIGEVQRNIGIPVIANGEIWTLDDFKRCRDETLCEHFMLGRGALADPNLPLQVARELGIMKSDPPGEFPPIKWYSILQRFSELSGDLPKTSGYMPCRIKQWTRLVHHRFPTPWFDQIKLLKRTEEIFDCLQNY